MKKISQTIKKKNKDCDKDLLQRYHFIKRMRERLQIKITDMDYDHIVSSIKNEKPCNLCKIEYKGNQSQRLMVFELTFPNIIPVDVIYDCKRKTLVTVLFQMDAIEVSYYYNVFKNRVNLKHDYGIDRPWSIQDDKLIIPNEELEYHEKYCEVVSEGLFKGKRFKIDNNQVYEVM